MGQKFKYILLMFLLLVVAHQTEGKRTLSGRSRTSSSGSRSSSSRRTQSHSYTPPSSSGSVTKSVGHAPNADHVKLTYGGLNSQPKPSLSQPSQNKPAYGWNVPQQPSVNKPPLNAGPPPAYSPHNVAGGAKTNIHEPPPAYKPNNAAPPAYPGNNQASYPKQTYNTASGSGYPQQSPGGYPHNTATGTGARPVGHNTGYRPHNGTGGLGGVHSPIYAHTVRPVQAGTYQQGGPPIGFYPHQTSGGHSVPSFPPGVHPVGGGFPAGVHPVGGGSFAYPQQAAPVFAGTGLQPGYYPPGSFPVQRGSSGPGFGSGLLAGALGGAILGHALTPTHTHVVGSNVGSVPAADNQDRIIVINNNPGQPATVTNGAGQPASGVSVIQNGNTQPGPAPAPNTGSSAVPEPPVPLAPFPNQPSQSQPNQAGAAASVAAGTAAGAAAGSTYTDGMVPLAPFPQSNTTEQPGNANAAQPQYGTYCVPVMVNATDPNNPSNVTMVEQVYCYNVLYPPSEQQTASNTTSQPGAQNQQPDLMAMPGNYNPPQNDISNIPTQRTSTASLAASTNIKSAAEGFFTRNSILNTFMMTLIAVSASYCMH